ncbi:diamine acetyltransferase 1-like [Pocillopora verrucosa]|uniref:diamine acetyltransferase 1-like n=1 Tax=Pocillopora verrucosa TaxID=203993 RepID=UPI00334190B0
MTSLKSHYGVREANRQDVPSIAKMIQDLADYLGKRDELKIGEKELLRDGFRKHPLFHCVIAEERVENIEELNDHTPTQNLEAPKKNKEALGVAIYYFTYSTWEGPVLYVEDLFVTPNARGQGIGSSLMAAIAKIAKSCDCQRMQWVSPSSERTMGFYRKLGAKSMPDWRLFRMEKSDIEELSLASE